MDDRDYNAMNSPKKSSITYRSYGIVATVEFDQDAQLEEVFAAFKGCLVAASWGENVIDNFILDQADEIQRGMNKHVDDE